MGGVKEINFIFLFLSLHFIDKFGICEQCSGQKAEEVVVCYAGYLPKGTESKRETRPVGNR